MLATATDKEERERTDVERLMMSTRIEMTREVWFMFWEDVWRWPDSVGPIDFVYIEQLSRSPVHLERCRLRLLNMFSPTRFFLY